MAIFKLIKYKIVLFVFDEVYILFHFNIEEEQLVSGVDIMTTLDVTSNVLDTVCRNCSCFIFNMVA
jgi:hypothetical protein